MKKQIAKISWHNEFGFVTTEIKYLKLFNNEATFLGIINSISKKIAKNWESIEFNGIIVRRDWLIETNFNFELSHEVL